MRVDVKHLEPSDILHFMGEHDVTKGLYTLSKVRPFKCNTFEIPRERPLQIEDAVLVTKLKDLPKRVTVGVYATDLLTGELLTFTVQSESLTHYLALVNRFQLFPFRAEIHRGSYTAETYHSGWHFRYISMNNNPWKEDEYDRIK